MNLTLKDICLELENIIIHRSDNLDMARPVQGVKRLTRKLSSLSGDIIYLIFARDLLNLQYASLFGECSATFLVGGNGNEELDEALDFTSQTDLGLIYCNEECDLDDISNTIQDLLMAKQALLARPAALFDTIIKGRGIPYILEIAGELLENPVLLGDGSHRLIGSSTFAPLDDEPWMEYRNTGFCTYEYTKKYQFESFIEASVSQNKAIIGDVSDHFKYRRIFATVVASSRVVGHLAVLEYNRPFTAKDMEIAEYICEIIASEMQATQNGAAQSNLMANQLFADLLAGNLQDEALLEKRLAGLRWSLPKEKYLMIVELDHFSESFSLIAYLKEALQDLTDFLETIVISGKLVVLLGLERSSNLCLEDIKDLEPYLKAQKLKAGISHPFENMIEFAKAYTQATRAIELGRASKEDHMIHRYQDYAIDDLLDTISPDVALEDHCHPALIKLDAYDKAHKTDLLNNLYVYITNMGNLLHSANELFIHRNTLSYRLNKISKITGCDITDQDQFISLFVSYKILGFLERK